MKRKEIDDEAKVGRYYVSEAMKGFWGDKMEGRKVLSAMGLRTDQPPFSIASFLKSRNANWNDANGNMVQVSFNRKPMMLECVGDYLGSKRVIKIYVEWSKQDSKDMADKLESEAIGNLCSQCLYDIIQNKTND